MMRKIEKFILENKAIMFIILFILLKPGVINQIPFMNTIFNSIMIFIVILIIGLYLYRGKYSGLNILLLCFFLILGFSTFINHNYIFYFLKIYLPIIGLVLYGQMCIESNKNNFLNILSLLFSTLIILNVISLIFPLNIFGDRMSFLGYDNNATSIIILGFLFILLRYKDSQKKWNLEIVVNIICLLLTIILIESATCKFMIVILILFFLLIYKRNLPINKFLKTKYIYAIFIFLFFAIVIFRLQSVLSFLIVNVLHRNLSFTGRTEIWDIAISLFTQKPIFGFGVLDPSIRLETLGIFHAHNTILQILVDGGLVSLFFYTLIWYYIYVLLKHSDDSETKKLFVFGVFVILITSLFEFYVKSSTIYLFLSMIYYISYIDSKACDSKKIAIISSGMLPIPAKKGGAVESLVQLFCDTKKKCTSKFDIYSCGSDEAIIKGSCTFHQINTSTFQFKIIKTFCAIVNRISNYRFGSGYINLIKCKMIFSKNGYTYYNSVLIENAPLFVLPLRRMFKNKIILHVHNDWLNLKTPNSSLIVNSCSKIITVSNFIKEQILTVQSKINSSDILVIYNGIDEKKFQCDISIQEKKYLLQKYNISDDDLVFLYTGKINEYKGTDKLINAFIKIAKNYHNVKLLMVGSSFGLDSEDDQFIIKMKKCIEQLENKIVFTGFISYEEIYKIYHIADIQIVPSQGIDSAPLTVLEGLMTGKALIVSNSGGIPELVNNKCAFIIPINNSFENNLFKKMSLLVEDKSKLEKMKKESLKQSKKFKKDVYCNKMLSIMEAQYDN